MVWQQNDDMRRVIRRQEICGREKEMNREKKGEGEKRKI
jgi:hypothetical protein